LSIDPSYKLIKQNERRYTLERRKTIWREVKKLLEVGFNRPVDYPSWLANLVLVEKPDGPWRMCIDYTSFNKDVLKMSILSLVFAKLLIPQRLVNYCRFWTPIRVIDKSASSLMMKKKQHSSLYLESFATQRWHFD
jgi:hypothetical protein